MLTRKQIKARERKENMARYRKARKPPNDASANFLSPERGPMYKYWRAKKAKILHEAHRHEEAMESTYYKGEDAPEGFALEHEYMIILDREHHVHLHIGVYLPDPRTLLSTVEDFVLWADTYIGEYHKVYHTMRRAAEQERAEMQ